MVFIASWQHYLRMHISLLDWNANKGRKKVPRLEEGTVLQKNTTQQKRVQQVSETVPENAP